MRNKLQSLSLLYDLFISSCPDFPEWYTTSYRMKETFPPKLILVMVFTSAIATLTKTIFIYEMSQNTQLLTKRIIQKWGGVTGDVTQLIERSPTMHITLCLRPSTMLSTPNTQEAVRMVTSSGSPSSIHISDLKTSKGYIRPCLKKKETKRAKSPALWQSTA